MVDKVNRVHHLQSGSGEECHLPLGEASQEHVVEDTDQTPLSISSSPIHSRLMAWLTKMTCDLKRMQPAVLTRLFS